jgi:hypothetical protein
LEHERTRFTGDPPDDPFEGPATGRNGAPLRLRSLPSSWKSSLHDRKCVILLL